MCQWEKQHQWTSKDYATSPTVSTHAIFLTGTIDAHKGCNVATMNLPGAFLHADVDEDVTMVMEGRLVELMVMTPLQIYCRYIAMNSEGSKVLFVWMQKVLLGKLKFALLFYWKLVEDLKK